MAKNNRCPLQQECGRKCEYVGVELKCDYYRNNGIGDKTIPDQEELREQIESLKAKEDFESVIVTLPDDEEETPPTNEAKLVYISVDKLEPHPDNPRKDLGDLTELADSIKIKGVMQNLTVVPFKSRTNPKFNGAGRYTVIIGHRRLGAAKLAGLTELPCVITEMTEQEQIATMLLENMQRSDLTVYEQAQGFQMMMDFGDSIDGISEKTGFSKSTVQRRLKMAKLDQDVLKEVSSRQLSLMDFDRLYELDDVEVQNLCLKEIGTSNFEQTLQYQLKKQNMAKMLPAVKGELKKLHATKISRSETYSGKYNSLGRTVYYYKWDGESPLFEQTSDKKMYYCLDEEYGTVALYTESERAKPIKRQPEEIEKEKQIEDAWKKADQLCEDMFNLRRQFIERFTVSTRNYDSVMNGAYIAAILHTITWCRSDSCGIHKIAGTENELFGEKNRKAIDALKGKPEKLAKVIYCTLGDSNQNCYFTGYKKQMPQYGENLPLDMLYEWLMKLGYEMSDEEKLLKDGKHPLYSNPVSDEDTGDDVDDEEIADEDFDEDDELDEIVEDETTDDEIISALKEKYGDGDE